MAPSGFVGVLTSSGVLVLNFQNLKASCSLRSRGLELLSTLSCKVGSLQNTAYKLEKKSICNVGNPHCSSCPITAPLPPKASSWIRSWLVV